MLRTALFATSLVVVAVVVASGGCGGEVNASGSRDAGGTGTGADATADLPGDGGAQGPGVPESGTFVAPDASSPATCFDPGAMCPGTPSCPRGGQTNLIGTVFDPAGKNPVYNAVVFIPNDPNGSLAPIVPGTSVCSTCPVIVGDYVSATVTDATGGFTLTQVPSGANVPLVVQIGKWRREVTLPRIEACTTTQVPAELTRLPRNRSEGDLPQMAVLTGACDGLACFMRRVGVDPQEFTGPDGGGRLHVYRGVGPGPDLMGGGGGTAGDCSGASGPCPLWSTKQELERYDTVLLGCECGENNQTKPDPTPMHDWLDEGGLVLAVHSQETWFKNGPADFQSVARWVSSSEGESSSGPFAADVSSPSNVTFRQWLGNAGALSADGTVALEAADVSTSMAAAIAPSSTWIYDLSASDAAAEANVKYLSFRTPTNGIDGTGGSGAQYCGRAVITDVHVGAAGAPGTAPVPASCSTADLSTEEKALEFLLFDPTPTCVATEGEVPVPPPPPL